ncbi:TlpA disulfide reductase family protein [Christiangramia sp. SM2212]|uniref:TlpA disulfide reductase family protein n=1 Tax=Christiangramia sediminicola TaxID=3073267 RepID=A0ABU1ENT8_9FLAO|nr:TlpA disulfide reductase family protein [Christiangramia sp. SM2212]MDR5590055.1 TlpA disulfide reductase family protein [Christiangramia sp. SM2212]
MRKLLLVFLFIGPTVFSQQENLQEKSFFTQKLYMHLSDYNRKADLAYRFNDYEKGQELFETFTSEHLEGSYMDNFKFQSLQKKKEVNLYDYKKPVFLITYASWCIPSKGEVPALNELAAEYKDQIDFVILFWDKKDKVKELSEKFSSDISIVYVDESKNNGAYVVRQLKHSLGLPTCFLLNENKKIMDIRRSVFPPMQTEEETAYRENYIALETSISNNLVNKYEEVYADNIQVE